MEHGFTRWGFPQEVNNVLINLWKKVFYLLNQKY